LRPPRWGNHAGQEPGIGREIDFDHHVHTGFSGEFHDPLTDVLAPVVDDMVGACPPRNLGLDGRTDRRDGAGLAFLGKLDGVMAHGSGAAGDEHARAGFDAGEFHCLIGGVGRNAEASSDFHARIGGERHGLSRGQHDRLGGGAEGPAPLAIPNPHPLPHARWRNAFTHALDLAGAVAVRNDARESDLARHAGAALDIGRVDARSGKAHAHLSGSRLWRLHLREAQHVAGRSVPLVIDSTHRCPLG